MKKILNYLIKFQIYKLIILMTFPMWAVSKFANKFPVRAGEGSLRGISPISTDMAIVYSATIISLTILLTLNKIKK